MFSPQSPEKFMTGSELELAAEERDEEESQIPPGTYNSGNRAVSSPTRTAANPLPHVPEALTKRDSEGLGIPDDWDTPAANLLPLVRATECEKVPEVRGTPRRVGDPEANPSPHVSGHPTARVSRQAKSLPHVSGTRKTKVSRTPGTPSSVGVPEPEAVGVPAQVHNTPDTQRITCIKVAKHKHITQHTFAFGEGDTIPYEYNEHKFKVTAGKHEQLNARKSNVYRSICTNTGETPYVFNLVETARNEHFSEEMDKKLRKKKAYIS
jgi:hypothetical protein